MENRVFFPQSALDQWIVDGSVELSAGILTILSESRRYELTEAVHVLREVSGAGDHHDLLNRVKTRASLEQSGAELVESSMLLGDAAYDVEPGWLGTPVGSFGDYVKAARGAAPGPKTDEELLATFLAKNL
jgi:hypothetical protein